MKSRQRFRKIVLFKNILDMIDVVVSHSPIKMDYVCLSLTVAETHKGSGTMHCRERPSSFGYLANELAAFVVAPVLELMR